MSPSIVICCSPAVATQLRDNPLNLGPFPHQILFKKKHLNSSFLERSESMFYKGTIALNNPHSFHISKNIAVSFGFPTTRALEDFPKNCKMLKTHRFIHFISMVFLINGGGSQSTNAIEKLNIALFASNGCFSHDIMMREVGKTFESMPVLTSMEMFENKTTISTQPYQIHWIQIFLYDFGFGQIEKPNHWKSVVMDKAGVVDLANHLALDGHKLLWEMNIPFDHNRPWDLRGVYIFYHILQRNHRFCQHFVRTKQFQEFIANVNSVDCVVVDHFIQECFTVAASLLNATVTVQFSNWPIADGYISSQNIPAPPSAYPTTGSPFSPKDMCHFFTRVRNTIWHAIILAVRKLLAILVNRFYASIGHPNLDLNQVEAKHLFYAGRAEFLAEPIRPISNRIKHFGCANCKQHNPTSLAHSNNTLQLDFPEVDWLTLERRKFLLVSFGSVAKVEFMPPQLLRLFFRAFASSPHLIIWQTNSPLAKIMLQKDGFELPANVRFLRWAPIKALLGHPNLRYAILHGGVNTVNEALMFGKPILGLPLQGDQPSNLQRLVDLGMAEVLDIRDVWAGHLEGRMAKLEADYDKYAERAAKVASMMNFHRRELGGGQQNFWLHWAVKKRQMIKEKGHRFFHFFYRSTLETFAFKEIGVAFLIFSLLIAILSV